MASPYGHANPAKFVPALAACLQNSLKKVIQVIKTHDQLGIEQTTARYHVIAALVLLDGHLAARAILCVVRYPEI